MSDPYVYGRHEHYTLKNHTPAPAVTREELEAATTEYLSNGGAITYLKFEEPDTSTSTILSAVSKYTGTVIGYDNTGILKFAGAWETNRHV